MHILYIHQHFATPEGSTGTRSYEFARRWVNAGHKVTLITGQYDIGGLEPSWWLIRKQSIEGINVVAVGISYSNRLPFLHRIISFLCFVVLGVYAGLTTEFVDVIYATSTPLTVGVLAMVLKWLRRKPYVFEVRDQWPEIPIEMGIIKNGLTKKSLLWLERTIYRQSIAIVALSPGMAAGVRAVLGEQKPVVVVPNSSDIMMFDPDVNGFATRKEQGWGDKLVMLHFGAMGRANGLEFIVNAADRLKDNPRIHFVLIGEGSEKPALVKEIERRGLKNVEILGSKPKVKLVEFVTACDVAMVIFANFQILENNSANKFFDSLSAGKAVLLNYSGWQRKILEDNDAGFGCSLYNLDEFVGKVLYFDSHRQELVKMGENARRLAVEEFDRDKLALQALRIITSVKGKH